MTEIRLANCDIKDYGACKLFEGLVKSKSIVLIDLSGNPLTEACFDAIETCLTSNPRIRSVIL